MAQQASFVQEGVDRIQTATDRARERVDEEVQKVQTEFQARRRRVEKEFSSRRKSFEKETRKQVKQFRTEIEKNSLVKELQRLQGEVTKQLESTLEALLARFRVASQMDLKRIDRKLTKINQRLKNIERAKTTHSRTPAVSH
jgi:hypothetical protein